MLTVLVSDWDKKTKRLSVSSDINGRFHFKDPLGALEKALRHRGEGKCVIIRPSWNEKDPSDGRNFFREWRSFDGELFSETRWYQDDPVDVISIRADVLDTALVLPNVPLWAAQ